MISFQVAEVEERYSMKIQGLMLNNSDMRRNYMKKCADLLDVQNNDSLKVCEECIYCKMLYCTVADLA